MPLYEYKCPRCGTKKEEYKPMSKSSEKVKCPKCNAEMKKYFGNQLVWNK